jgi:hypothetical protein
VLADSLASEVHEDQLEEVAFQELDELLGLQDAGQFYLVLLEEAVRVLGEGAEGGE